MQLAVIPQVMKGESSGGGDKHESSSLISAILPLCDWDSPKNMKRQKAQTARCSENYSFPECLSLC